MKIKSKAYITASGRRILVVCRTIEGGKFGWYINLGDEEELLEDTYPVDSLEEAETMLLNNYPRRVYETEILPNEK